MFKIGDRVEFKSYGEIKTDIIVRLGSGIVFFANGRFMHVISIKKV